MSEFHRMVTYLYLYESNQKTRNVGYAKIEKREAHCRVEIHMKNTGIMEHDIPVYFYTQNNSGFPGILLGSINFNRGAGEFRELLDSNHISGTEYDISHIKGLFCPVSEQKMIVSQWDDDAFDRSSFFPATAQGSGTVDSPATVQGSEAINFSATPQGSGAVNSPVTPQGSEAMNFSATPQGSGAVNLKAAEAAPDLSCEMQEEENHQASGFTVPESQSPRWNFIMENFPSTAPFPCSDSFEWVRLELKDLKLMPKSHWHLSNNSFLLHGFFNYHHLILGRKREALPGQWTLGVPGVFQNPERVMATLFGFPEFRSTSESNIKTGQFGYWLRPLE